MIGVRWGRRGQGLARSGGAEASRMMGWADERADEEAQ